MGVSIRVSGANFTNKIAAAIRYVRFSTLALFVESGNSDVGYTYTCTAADTAGSYVNGVSHKIPSGVDGWFQANISRSAGTTVFCVGNSNALTAFNSAGAQVGISLSGSGNYTVSEAGAISSPASGGVIAQMPSDIIRIVRTGSTWTAYLSRDGGTVFTTLHQFITTYSGDAYLMLDAASGPATGSFSKIQTSGLAV